MSKHTPGPWRWEVDRDSKDVQLTGGIPQFDLTVMDFHRWGMNDAQPRFREDVDRLNIMHPISQWPELIEPIFGREHHFNWCATINHPDANLIAAAPELLCSAKSVDRMYSVVERQGELIAKRVHRDIAGNGRFGIAVHRDDEALEWQALEAERLAILNAAKAAIAKAEGNRP